MSFRFFPRRRWKGLPALAIVAVTMAGLMVRLGQAATLTAGGYTTSASASPTSVAPGAITAITASITSNTTITVLIDLEIYAPSGAKVSQQYFDNQSLTAGVRKTFSYSWQVPGNEAVGTHTVIVGVFAPGWSALYHWNNNAATVSVAGTTGTATATVTATSVPSPAPSAGTRVSWQGGKWYLHGANVPWVNWGCDFGCGANGGVSSAGVQNTLTSAFSQAKTAGVHTIRWWAFEGGAWQITRDASGAPTGVNSAVYADFDAALQLAQTYDLYYNFVLFGGPTDVPSGWVTDATQRTKLATALGPLFARYKNNPRVLSWEIFNEPEWDIWGGKIAQAPVQATVKALAAAVHANSPALVTVGSAHVGGLPMWVGQGLDYYSPHWYDYMGSGGWCARCRDYASLKAEYNVDAPVVIGEFYAGPDADALQRFEDFYAKGYAGAWAWSILPDHTNDHMAVDMAASKTFAGRHGDLGPRAGAPTPTATATPTPTVTATAVPTATTTKTPTPTPTVPPTATATKTPPPTATGTAVATQTVTFDDRAGQDQALTGQYPTGVIDWGTTQWYLSGPWGKFATKSVSFNGRGLTSATLRFLSPRQLVRLDAYNGGGNSTTVTLSCAGKPTRTFTLAAGQLATLQTGWTGTCTTVTVASSNGWDTNFDNLVLATN